MTSRKVLFAAALIAPILLGAEDIAPMALNSLSAPPRQIAAAQVMDQRGQVIGAVAGVAVDASGKPSAISIRPANGKGVTVVSAAAASYDGTRNIVVTATPENRIAAR